MKSSAIIRGKLRVANSLLVIESVLVLIFNGLVSVDWGSGWRGKLLSGTVYTSLIFEDVTPRPDVGVVLVFLATDVRFIAEDSFIGESVS